MADGDKITIDQINWDDSNLPKWATEATQQRIATALGAIKKTDEKREKEDQKQTKEIKSLSKRFEDSMKASNENSKKLLASLKDKGGDYTKDMVKKNLQTPFKSVNEQLGKFGKSLGLPGAALVGLASAIGFVIGRLKQFSDAYRQAFSMGFRFTDGAMGLSKAAVAAEMGIGQFTELLSKYSTSAGLLGVNSLQDLTIGVKDTLQPLGLLGMSLDELAEYTVDYADQLRVAGLLEGKSNEELEKLVANYAQNITAFSRLANVSREQIAQVIKSSTSIEAFTNKLNVLPAVVQTRVLQAAQTITGMFAGLGTEFGDQLATTFTTAYGRGGLFFTQAGRELLAVNRELYNSMSGIIDNMNSLDDAGAAKATANLIDQIANTSDAERERLALIERSNSQFAGAARQQIALINQVQQIQKNGAIEQFKDLKRLRQTATLDKLSIGFINFERVVAKLRTAFNNFFNTLFGNERIMDVLSTAIETLGTKGIGLAETLVENAGAIADKIAKLIERFMNFIGGFQGLTLGESIARALTGVFSVLQEAIVGSIIKGFKLVLPWFFGGDSTIKDAEEARMKAVNNAIALKQALETGDPSSLTTSALPGLTKAQNKGPKSRTKAYTDILTDGLSPTDQVKVGNMIQRAYDGLGKNSGKPEALRSAILSGIQNLDSDTRTAVLAKMLEVQNKTIAKQEEIINLAAGSDVNLSTSQVSVNNQTGSGSVPKSTLVSDKEPQSLTDAKMRIMKQYLPMQNDADPMKDATGNYYEMMIYRLKEQIDQQQNQLDLLRQIEINTK